MNETVNVVEFLQAFGRLEEKVDSLLRMERERITRETALEIRVRALENWRAWILGALALMGAAMTAALTLV